MNPEAKRPGRPRDDALDDEIRRALFELIEEVGIARTTIEAIAQRAGVSKATIYRRWDSKEELIVDAVASLVDIDGIAETGDIREEMLGGLNLMHSFMSSTTAGVVFPWLAGEMARGSEIGQRYLETVILPRRRLMAARIHKAIERGELRSDLNVELAVDMLSGPFILRKLVDVGPALGPEWDEQFVDALLDGWRGRQP